MTMAADGRGWPRKLLRLDVRGNFRGNCRGRRRISVVIAALLWQWPRVAMEYVTAVSTETAVAFAADYRELPRSVQRSVPRTEPRHVPWPQPWRLPWKYH